MLYMIVTLHTQVFTELYQLDLHNCYSSSDNFYKIETFPGLFEADSNRKKTI